MTKSLGQFQGSTRTPRKNNRQRRRQRIKYCRTAATRMRGASVRIIHARMHTGSTGSASPNCLTLKAISLFLHSRENPHEATNAPWVGFRVHRHVSCAGAPDSRALLRQQEVRRHVLRRILPVLAQDNQASVLHRRD